MITAWPWVRATGAGLIAAALIAQLIASTQSAVKFDRDVATTIANFFSFFTVQSNFLAMLALAFGAVWLWSRGREETAESRGYATFLACVTTYMAVTGIVYNTLLRGIPLPQGTTVPWSNEVLHVIGPLFLLADLLFAPRRRGLSWKAIGIIAIYPIAWAIYTLVRAPLTINPVNGEAFWYPYPFLNPHLTPGGYLGVAGYVVGIAVAIVAVGTLVVWWGRRRAMSASVGAVEVIA